MARIVAKDVELGGRRMAAGDWVLLPFPAANRDPEVFEDADRVVLDRAVNRHASFGLGIHRCLGSNLARMELTVALEEWMARFPDFELADPGRRHLVGRTGPGPRRLPVRLLAAGRVAASPDAAREDRSVTASPIPERGCTLQMHDGGGSVGQTPSPWRPAPAAKRAAPGRVSPLRDGGQPELELAPAARPARRASH